MSTALFPDGLTRTAWDDLQYRCKQYDDDREHWAINNDPAKGWVIRTADLITIGAMRHIADPENYEGQSLPGWTIKRFRYAHHIPAHREQMAAADRWFEKHGVVGVWDVMEGAGPGYPEGGLIANGLAFRDPDGRSAPVDATGLQGWTLYTGEVIGHAVDPDFEGLTPGEVLAAVEALEAAPVKVAPAPAPKWEKVAHPNPTSGGFVSAPFELTPPMVTAPTTPAPQPPRGAGLGDPNTGYEPTGPSKIELAPQPPAVKVGDRVLLRDVGNTIVGSRVEEVSPSGNYVQPEWTHRWFAVIDVLEVLPPRATED